MDRTGPIVDVTSLEAIAGLQGAGGEALLKNVVELYLSTSLSLMQKLSEAVAAADSRAIMEAAHTLKSSSAQLGARRLAKALQEIESMGRDEETEAAPETLVRVHQEFDAAREAFEAFLSARYAR
jgi:HPt (histidine-containing phosphotransfer) domain-containing protein